MGAVVAAATHAPLTVILITFEMTGDYRMILGLMLATLIATTLSLRLSADSIYTLKLARRGSKVGGANDEVMQCTAVEMLLRSPASVIERGLPFAEVVRRALEASPRPVYVVDRAGHLAGTILLADVAALIRDQDVLEDVLIANDVMRPINHTVSLDDTLAVCLKILGRKGRPELPVTDADESLLGVVTRSDILGLYDREVLLRGHGAVAVVDGAHGPASFTSVHVPKGEQVETVVVCGELAGRTLRGLDLRARHGVHVHGVKRGEGEPARRAEPRTPLEEGEVLLVTGPPKGIAALRAMTE